MRIVLDTNALLISIAQKSIYRPIFDALINGKFELILSNEILSEYIEIIERKTNSIVFNNIAEMLLSLENLHKVDVFFTWKFITSDPDDNKYVDAAIAGAVSCLVTNDQHFKELNNIDFPKVKVLTIDDFLKMVKKDK